MSFFRIALGRRNPLLPKSILARRQFTLSAITMAKQEWLVILPDKANVLSQRMEVRPQHLADTKPHVETGFLVLGGATLDEPIKEGQPPKINGSVMVAQADTEEEVLAWVHNDVYSKNGVWDLSQVKVIPFKSALRKEL